MDEKLSLNSHISDHLANERTFLAWVRTSVGIMAFGFVVEKFSLFLKQVSIFLMAHADDSIKISAPVKGYASIFGVCLIIFGALLCFFAFVKYKSIEKQIDTGIYYPSFLLDIMLTLAIILMGIFLAIYLI